MNKKWKETLYECWKNKNFMIGFVILLSVIILAAFADIIAPYEYTEQNVGGRFQAPDADFWFGTDDLGRDMFSRVIYGSRIALWVAFLGAMIQLLIGVAVGLACGFFGRWVDRGLSFLTDLTWCIPGTILALAPGIALVYTTFGFNLIGEGLRDLLDPHMKSQ